MVVVSAAAAVVVVVVVAAAAVKVNVEIIDILVTGRGGL
jgi:hypothetical protein